jgi:hypothetical protein
VSAFQQNLPIQILPKEQNPEGIKYQGVFEAMEPLRMKIRIDKSFHSENRSGDIVVEFAMSNFNFQFESSLIEERDGDFIYILKPRVIHKSQIRKAARLKCYIRFNFTIWTEGGRFDAIITDLSTVGLKMTGDKSLTKNTILSLNVFIPGTSLRFICQGLVMWSMPAPNRDQLFMTGVKFTTLSIDAMKKVDKYIQEQLKLQVAS